MPFFDSGFIMKKSVFHATPAKTLCRGMKTLFFFIHFQEVNNHDHIDASADPEG